MRKLIVMFVIAVFLSGCSMFMKPDQRLDFYRLHILEWQQKIQEEGWSKSLVDDIMTESIYLANYKSEELDENGRLADDWQMPSEFIKNNFKGDCEDIATFLFWNLKKRLNYPLQVRIRAVATLLPNVEHALLRVELPNGKWKTYETVPVGGLNIIDRLFYRTLFEFDDQQIYLAHEI